MFLIITLLLVLGCATVGVWIARTRGRSTALGVALGLAGPIGWFTLSALPTIPSEAAHWGREATVTRVEDRLVRVLYWPTLLTYGLLAGIGFVISGSPPWLAMLMQEGNWLNGIFTLAALTVLLNAFVLWAAAFSLLLSDRRLPGSARGLWAVALLFGNMVAAFFFHPWRLRVLRKQQSRSHRSRVVGPRREGR